MKNYTDNEKISFLVGVVFMAGIFYIYLGYAILFAPTCVVSPI